MSDKWDGLDQAFSEVWTERMAERRTAASSEEERARKLSALKEQVRAGVYKPDIKDIARLLTSALDQGV